MIAGDEAVFLVRGNENRYAAGHADQLRIGDPAGGGNQDFIPGVQNRLEDGEEAVFGAVADDNLLRGISQAMIPLHFTGDRHAQLHGPGDGRIARQPHVQRFLRGFADVRRGGKIRLAGAETDHVHTGGGHFLGPGVDLQSQGGSDIQTTVGNGQRHGGGLLQA